MGSNKKFLHQGRGGNFRLLREKTETVAFRCILGLIIQRRELKMKLNMTRSRACKEVLNNQYNSNKE
jgi:hypothetical protein